MIKGVYPGMEKTDVFFVTGYQLRISILQRVVNSNDLEETLVYREAFLKVSTLCIYEKVFGRNLKKLFGIT